jgi:hypothetical protein
VGNQSLVTVKGGRVAKDTVMGMWKQPIGNIKPKADKEWFQEQLRRRELTQTAVAAMMEVDPATLSYALNGTRELKVREAVGLAQILDVPVAEILRRWGFEIPNDERTVPIVAVVNDDMTCSPRDQPYNRTVAPPGVPSDATAIVFRPSYGVGGFWDGMTAFIEPGVQDMRHCVGYLSLIQTEDGTCLVGVLSRGHDTGVFTVTHPGTRNTSAETRVAKANRALWLRSGQ